MFYIMTLIMGVALTNTVISKARAFFVVLPRDEYRPELLHFKKTKIAKYAKEHKDSVIINAGLFFINSREPNGQFVIDGVDKSVIDYVKDDKGKPISDYECYPLVIDDDYRLSVSSHDRMSTENSREYLASHYRHVVTGWGSLIEDGKPTNLIDDEWRWGKARKSRQIIGELNDGHYFILTCENAYYKDICSFLRDKAIRFAYSLDGGRSTKLFVDGKKLNVSPIKIGVRYMIPTVIEFKKIR